MGIGTTYFAKSTNSDRSFDAGTRQLFDPILEVISDILKILSSLLSPVSTEQNPAQVKRRGTDMKGEISFFLFPGEKSRERGSEFLLLSRFLHG